MFNILQKIMSRPCIRIVICMLIAMTHSGNAYSNTQDYSLNDRPQNVIKFNNGNWNDLTKAFNVGRNVYFFTDNKYSGTAELTIWAVYDREQNFSLRKHYEKIYEDNGKTNFGNHAKIHHLELYTSLSKEMYATMDNDGLSGSARDQIKKQAGSLSQVYIYRIHIKSPDRGMYASYVLTGTTPAAAAYGLVKLDTVGGNDTGRALAGSIGRATAIKHDPSTDFIGEQDDSKGNCTDTECFSCLVTNARPFDRPTTKPKAAIAKYYKSRNDACEAAAKICGSDCNKTVYERFGFGAGTNYQCSAAAAGMVNKTKWWIKFAGAGSLEEAEAKALKSCEKGSDACTVVVSDCVK